MSEFGRSPVWWGCLCLDPPNPAMDLDPATDVRSVPPLTGVGESPHFYETLDSGVTPVALHLSWSASPQT